MVPLRGFEPPTHALRMRCSTPELQRRILGVCDAKMHEVDSLFLMNLQALLGYGYCGAKVKTGVSTQW